MRSLSDFLKKIQAKGRLMFTVDEVVDVLAMTRNALKKSIQRLKKKGDIVSPYKGLYFIVPPDEANFGCIPAQELLPLLMEHLKVNYYVAFLSAAQYHGAAHQKPMVFQVVTEKRMRNIHCGHVRIWFTHKKDISKIPIEKRVVPTGYLNVSTPESTAMDIISFQKQSVGINNIATLLSELIEEIKIPKLIEMADISSQNAWVQRMGYILEHTDSMVEDHQKDLINALYNYLRDKKLSYIPLSTSEKRLGFRDKKWKIIENTTVESDL